ncbi:PilZ domain-containing protein [Paenibacillus nasutitermitis]|uniref:PilZ domain-containing protein n=1 Tax=Paenibacillus nasutitermitis TaxID=1652958 RepID=A0A916Z647_9BACL|nr:PilZ domain-containing protein [Paenibacillus nasutitermitis]GGD75973.1 hypothetical protein GCM10010911_37470 [Paenibacillus nasutitermitis]
MVAVHTQAVQQRQHMRIRIREGIQVSVFIANVQGSALESKGIPVMLKDISPTGLRFQTHLRFPVSGDYTVRFIIKFSGWEFNLCGNVVWRGRDENQYVYGSCFQPDPEMRRALIRAISLKLDECDPLGKRVHELYTRLSENKEKLGLEIDVKS